MSRFKITGLHELFQNYFSEFLSVNDLVSNLEAT